MPHIEREKKTYKTVSREGNINARRLLAKVLEKMEDTSKFELELSGEEWGGLHVLLTDHLADLEERFVELTMDRVQAKDQRYRRRAERREAVPFSSQGERDQNIIDELKRYMMPMKDSIQKLRSDIGRIEQKMHEGK